MDAAMLDYFVKGEAPAGFVEAMRHSLQDLKVWCADQSMDVLKQAQRVLHVHHEVWHKILREEIEARNAAGARKEARAIDKRNTALTSMSIALSMLAVIITIVLALR
jgi:hypothetical protein